MNSFSGFLLKEFFHILRDRRTAAILFGMPLLQLLLFGFAIRNEILDVNLGILDQSHDRVTREISDKLLSSGYFVLVERFNSVEDISRAFAEGRVSEVIVFEPGFGDRLIREGKASLSVMTDGSNPNSSKIVTGYTSSVIQEYRNARFGYPGSAFRGVEAVPLMLFNPSLSSVHLFVPGLMALILMLVSALMTSISITREKESGTMEILLVSSLRPIEIIVGKVVPYLLLSIVNVVTVLSIASLVFGVPCRGSLALLMAESLLFIVTALALGMFISSITNSQQVAMMIALAGLLLPTILLSGFIFPVPSMPLPLQFISNFIPAKWYLVIVRGIMLKGTGLTHLWKESLILVVMTAGLLVASIRKFKVRL